MLNNTSTKEFEERADFISESDLLNWTVENDFFRSIQKSVIGRGAKLIVGPRGSGKTHQLRYAYSECIKNPDRPLAIYVSFGKYYHLEPLLFNSSNAINIFHAWVLAKILLGCYDVLHALQQSNISLLYSDQLNEAELKSFIEKAERYRDLPEFDELIRFLSIQRTVDIVENLTQKAERKRAILLLDDAALTLTPDYMVEFFDIFRSLKTPHINPKASVYPGTTQYGPRFHVGQDAEEILAWLNVEEESYSSFMDELIEKRFKDFQIKNTSLIEVLKFASFGIPRAFITLIRSYQNDNGKTVQQKFNNVINNQKDLLEKEYLSLRLKLPQYKSIIKLGLEFFAKVINQLTEANRENQNPDEKRVHVGIKEDGDTYRADRMIKFLIEAGFLYEWSQIHDGPERSFRRYIPHFLFLIQNRAFSLTRGFNSKEIVTFINRKTNRRPLRTSISSLLGEQLNHIKLNLPPCSNCGTERLTEGQKFCHNCGHALVGQSAFEACLKLKIDDLPIPGWQKERIKKETRISTIEDILTSQSPATELKKARGIGNVKSQKIYEIAKKTLEEFLA